MQAVIDFLLMVWRHILPLWIVQPWEGGVVTYFGKWYRRVGPGVEVGNAVG